MTLRFHSFAAAAIPLGAVPLIGAMLVAPLVGRPATTMQPASRESVCSRRADSAAAAAFSEAIPPATSGGDSTPGPRPDPIDHSASLHCVDLLPAAGIVARGTVELIPAPSPFGASVTREGRHSYDLAVTLEGLPDPRTLGNYTTYVAWATTPRLSPMLRLGEVRNGQARLGPIALNKALLLVSAERSADVRERTGRLVLRGMSPSNLLLPTDAAMLPGRSVTGDSAHAHHARDGWVMPPMHPMVPTMTPGLEGLVPQTPPWLPGAGADTASIPFATPRQVIAVADGDSLVLTAGLVRRRVAGRVVVGYGFNGQDPGPLIRVTERSTIVVNFTNRLEVPTAVHWHGVRLDNRFDGVPHVTQEPVAPGASFRYVIRFPDPGIYWYHPHVREDAQQDLGLFGNLLVRSERADYYAPADREEVLILDDMLFAGEELVPYGRDHATHALMGRFGNVLLVNGEARYSLRVGRGEVVRFFLTNVSNTRVFNVSLGGTRMKVVASDLGRFERDEWVESVVISPAERYVVEARFDSAGQVALVNAVQAIDHQAGVFFPEVDTLGVVTVEPRLSRGRAASAFETLHERRDVAAEIEGAIRRSANAPSRTLVLSVRTRDLPFGLWQILRLDTAYVNPVEWSGTMPMMDLIPTAAEVQWVLRDRDTGRENMDIAWRFRRGELVRMRLVNDRATLHPMHHPVHIHGQRFLVVARNGVPTRNRVWKDTVLLPTGTTADLLVEMSNPGRWMLHCHIAEHIEAGMHMVFEVEP